MSGAKQTVQCPKCSASVSANAELIGKRVRCPKCEATFKVPGIAASKNDDDDWFSFDDPVEQVQPADVVSAGESSAADNHSPAFDLGDEPIDSPRSEMFPPDETVPPSDVDDLFGDIPDLAPAKQRAPKSSGSLEEFGFPDLTDDDLDALRFPAAAAFPTAQPKPASSPGEDDVEVLSEADVFDDFGQDVPEVKSAEVELEFRYPCPICDTAHYAKPSDEGKQVKCPDCTSRITVPPPPKVIKKLHKPVSNSAAFGLKESVVRRDRQDSPFTKSAADLLRDAEASQLEEDLDGLYSTNLDNPDVMKWLANIVKIFIDPGVVAHLVFLGLVFTFVLSGLYMMDNAGLLPVAMIGGVSAVICGSLLCACSLAILQSTSIGESTVQQWPYMDPAEWLGTAFLMVMACAVASVPGQLMGMLATFGDPLAAPLFYIVFVMLSVWAILPVVLLSMLDNGSMLNPYSKDVIASFERCKEPWGAMYFSSGLFFFAYFMLLFLTTASTNPITAAFAGFGLVGLAFVYARLLGNVAFAIGQSVTVGGNEPPTSDK